MGSGERRPWDGDTNTRGSSGSWRGREGPDDDIDNDPELQGLEYAEFRQLKREKLRKLQRHLLWRITPSPSPSPPSSPRGGASRTDSRYDPSAEASGDGADKEEDHEALPAAGASTVSNLNGAQARSQ